MSRWTRRKRTAASRRWQVSNSPTRKSARKPPRRTTVGSLAYSIVADTKQFIAGVVATMAELRALKGHFHESSHGASELSESMDRLNSRMGRMALSEVMGQLKEIPGAFIAMDLAMGNSLGAVVGMFALANEAVHHHYEEIEKSAKAYEGLNEEFKQFKELAEELTKAEQARLFSPEELKRQEETKLGHAIGREDNSWLGTMQERNPLRGAGTALGEWMVGASGQTASVEQRMGANSIASAQGHGTQQALAEHAAMLDELDAMDKEHAIASHVAMLDELDAIDEKNNERAIASHVDMLDKMDEADQKLGDKLRESLESPAEKLSDRLSELQDAFDRGVIGADTYARGLEDIQAKAEAMADQDRGTKGITSAVGSATAEGIAARFGTNGKDTAEKHLKESQKATKLLDDIKSAIKDAPQMGVVA